VCFTHNFSYIYVYNKIGQTTSRYLSPALNSDTVGVLQLVIPLPLSTYTCGKARSLLHLHNRLNKCGGISRWQPEWQVVETNAEHLSLVKMKYIPSSCIAMMVQIYSSFEYNVTMNGVQFQASRENV